MERFKTVRQLEKKIDRLERTELLQKELSKKQGGQSAKILALSAAIVTGLFYLFRG